MSQIIEQSEVVTLGKDGSLTYRDGISSGEWFDVHRKLVHAKRYAAAWLKKSREYAIRMWGIDFVAKAEEQMEFDLEIEYNEKPPSINGPDKSGAYINIHGIATGLDIWFRKVEDEIGEWDDTQKSTLKELLEPMERKLKRVRELMGE